MMAEEHAIFKSKMQFDTQYGFLPQTNPTQGTCKLTCPNF